MDTPTRPGWHPDPMLENTARFWDGEKWTDQTAPLMDPARESKSARLLRIFALLLVVLALLVAIEIAYVAVN